MVAGYISDSVWVMKRKETNGVLGFLTRSLLASTTWKLSRLCTKRKMFVVEFKSRNKYYVLRMRSAKILYLLLKVK